MLVWLNGEFVPRDGVRVSAFDAGFQHAVGLFETMLARNGRVFRIDAHLDRLEASAGELRLSERLRTGPLAEAVQRTLEANETDQGRVRLTVTGGDLNLLQSEHRHPQDPTILIVVQPPTEYPAAFFEAGVKTVFAAARSNPWEPNAGHKTLNYWPRIRMLQDAAARQAAEAVWLTIAAEVAGGCVSNLFMVRDGALHTPPARGETAPDADPSPVLPGVTRATIIELADERGVPVHRRPIAADGLFEADEIFLTNSSWGVLPVVALERERIGDGAVGPVTRSMREAWLEVVDLETR
ncbi:MAG: hypothetical protein GY715_03605 [Planctomycetes bacterium]|nr:hypothetical protein [Planctomycetota bacterium]